MVTVEGGHPSCRVDGHDLDPGHGGLAEPPCHDCGVRGEPATRGDDRLGGEHPAEVVGARLRTGQHDVATEGAPLHRRGGVEDELSDGRSGAGREAGRQRCGLAHPEGGVEQGRQLVAVDPGEGFVELDEALVGELRGNTEGRGRAALAEPGLQDPEAAALHGELHVAEVTVVPLQGLEVPRQLRVDLRVAPVQLREVHRAADTADDVLTLGIRQVVAEGADLAGHRVAREADTAAGALATVAEDHLDDVDSRPEVVGDALMGPVEAGALAVPGAEDRADRLAQLDVRILGQFLAGLLDDDRPEVVCEALEVSRVELGVGGDSGVGPGLSQQVIEAGALDAEDGASVHLAEAPVAVPREVGLPAVGQGGDDLVVQPDVEDGLHHARHRRTSPRTGPTRAGVGPGRRARGRSAARGRPERRRPGPTGPPGRHRRRGRRGTPPS